MQVRVSSEINRILEEAAALSVKRGQFFVGVDAVFEVLYQKFEEMLQGVPADIKRGLQWVLQELDRERWRGVPPSNVQDVFFTTRCCNVINEAARIATQLSGASPNGKHLLLAILSDPLAAPSRAMDVLQLNRKQLIETLRESLYRTKLGATRTKEDVAARTTMDMPPNETAVESTKDTDDYGLQRLTRDLTALARAGKLEPAIGRSGEITQLLEILGRKTKNNAILVGDAGVGKTRIVEGLALALASGSTGRFLENARIVELNIGLLTAGTEFRGAFEKRVAQLLEEIERIPNLILFIDEVHLIMGAGSTEGSPVDLANLLKPALARGNLRCIGATTLEEYRKFIERDPAIERRFQMVRVEELSPATTLEVLEHLRPSLERHHGVRISRRALKSAVELTQRYMPERRFPDKAIDVLDQACARHRLRLAALAARNPQQSPTETSTTLEEKITPHDIR
ncbi:MAG TPA: AAA family ATPase, partial [Candidatus Hydrogenedentes bacterium]|nr:AAA family ATPase [Candidatus Hydrogenedentota bacterium]